MKTLILLLFTLSMVEVSLASEELKIAPARAFPAYDKIRLATTGITNRFFTQFFEVGDLNKDQRPDVVVTEVGDPSSPGPLLAVVLLQAEDGSLVRQAQSYEIPSPDPYLPRDPLLLDINGDSNLDFLIVIKGTDLVAMLGKGDGTFQTPSVLGINAVGFPSLADFNGDGRIDIVAATREGVAMIHLGATNGSYVPGVTLDTVTNPYGERQGKTMIGDINGDGKLDIAVASTLDTDSTWTGNLDVFPGQGDGTFQEPIRTPNVGTYSGVLADFNQDGILDFAGIRYTPTTMEVWLGQGDGHFKKMSANYPLNEYWPVWIKTADVNGDSILDLVVINEVPGSLPGPLAIYLGRGDGSFQLRRLHTPLDAGQFGPQPAFVDWNRDGRLDLISLAYADNISTKTTLALNLNLGSAPALQLGIQLTVANTTNSPTIVEAATDFTAWTPIATNSPAMPIWSLIVPSGASNARFYRTRRPD